MRKPIRDYGEAGAPNKVVHLERWRQTGNSEPDTTGSPGGESPSEPLAARGLDWRQAIAQMSREEKQAVLLMFILAPAGIRLLSSPFDETLPPRRNTRPENG